MYVYTDGWIHACLDVCIYGWMDGLVPVYMHGCLDVCIYGGWLIGWTHRSLDVCMDELIQKGAWFGLGKCHSLTSLAGRYTHSLGTCFVTDTAPGVGSTQFLPASGLPSKE